MVVDKPAFLGFDDTKRILEVAGREGRCVAEAIVCACHPSIAIARDIFAAAYTEPTHIVAVFSMPPRPSGNFRNRADLGGGCLWGLGPYAITPVECSLTQVTVRLRVVAFQRPLRSTQASESLQAILKVDPSWVRSVIQPPT